MRLGPLILVTFCAAACSKGTLKTPDAGGGGAVDMSIPLPKATMIAPVTTMTTCLAIDANRLYWSDFGTGSAAVLSVPLAGGTPATVVAGGDKYTCVATDGSSVFYFADKGRTLMKAPAAGGNGVAIAANQNLLGDRLVVANGSVYWLTDTYGNVDMFNGKYAVVRIDAKTGASAADVMPFFANVDTNARGLAVDATNVYYSDRGGAFFVPLGNPASATKFGIVPLPPSQLVTGNGRVALNEAAGGGAGDVAVYKSDGTGRQVVSTKLGTPLAVDDKGVYLALDGQLARLALDGSGPTYLTAQAPRAVALSASTIYFTDGATIWSLPR